jgi:biopolymer transport protein ExbB
MRFSFLLLLTLLLTPLSVQAWWNEGWEYRKELMLDTSATGANISGELQNVPVLVRLHTGNFSYFLDIQPKGEDIRFIAGDDQTPLKFNIERFDAINEMALIWVLLPEVKPGGQETSIWMYYGNQTAVAAEDVSGSYGPQQTLVYHFNDGKIPPLDATAYNNRTSQFDAQLNVPTLIGNGSSFDGQMNFVIADSPVLVTDPAQGWTWSAWLKIDEEQLDTFVFERSSDSGRLVLGIDGISLYASSVDASGNQIETPRTAQLTVGGWHHVALTIGASRMSLFVDGNEVSYADTVLPVLQGDIVIGSSAAGSNGFIGTLDELNLYNVSRSASWFQAAISSQGPAANLIIYGEDASQESGSSSNSHFNFVMSKLTFDAKVVIVFLMLMSVISWVVMVMKWFYLRRVSTDNKKFLEAYYALGTDDPAMLDRKDTAEDKELEAAPVAQALFGEHDHFQSSPIYHMYHRGISEVKARVGTAVGAQASAMTEQSANAIRAVLDADMVRESQKINSKMVLLTIAISGGPFIGLLGTVIGVMITFAEMASTGDVSIASIAPGMAAALMATIVGLWVAIPALFGYNYLGTNIKNINADMHVFIDEFVTRVAEYYGK